MSDELKPESDAELAHVIFGLLQQVDDGYDNDLAYFTDKILAHIPAHVEREAKRKTLQKVQKKLHLLETRIMHGAHLDKPGGEAVLFLDQVYSVVEKLLDEL